MVTNGGFTLFLLEPAQEGRVEGFGPDQAEVGGHRVEATERQLFEAPALVVAFDERSDGGAHVGEVVKDPAVDRLLLERAIPALDDPVGFRLFEEAEAGVDAPVAAGGDAGVKEGACGAWRTPR